MKGVFNVAAAVLLVAMPVVASAEVPSSEVSSAMGAWTFTLDGPMGPFELKVTLSDNGGKVGAKVEGSSDLTPGPVSAISKAGNDLTLEFEIDVQGMTIPSKLIITPDGAMATAKWELMGGAFTAPGKGVKQ